MVINASLFALFAIAVGYGYLRLPLVNDYRKCYRGAYSIYNEREKGVIIRRFNLGEEAICLENKEVIMTSIGCLNGVDQAGAASAREKELLKKAAELTLAGPRNIDEMVNEHNGRCPMAKTVINFDPRTGTWF